MYKKKNPATVDICSGKSALLPISAFRGRLPGNNSKVGFCQLRWFLGKTLFSLLHLHHFLLASVFIV